MSFRLNRSVVVGLFLFLLFFSSASVFAQTLIPFNPGDYPGVNFDIVKGGGAQGVVDTIRGLFGTVKQILAPILVLLIAWFGVRLVTAGGDEAKFTAASQHFLYLLIGTAFVVFSNFLSETFFLYQGGESFVSSPENISDASDRFQTQVELLIKFLRYILGSVAVFFIVKSGATIIYSADDELVNKQKDVFMYGFVGFLLIIISEALINVVFDVDTIDGVTQLGEVFVSQEVNVGGGLSLLGNITNLFLAALSGLFLFMLVAGGVMYAASGGNEEATGKATKIITGALIGLIIAFSSYTIVAEFASGGRAVPEANPQTVPINPTVPVSPTAPNSPALPSTP